MKKIAYEKICAVEIVENQGTTVLIQNVGKPEDQWGADTDSFHETYRPVLRDFGWTVRQLKKGLKLQRKGWNGRGMWIALMPELYLDKDIINGRTKKHIGEGVDLDSQPYIVMWTAQGKWQPGWLASMQDILAEDWEVVE